ncbi:hypothetical protein [Paucibacter sp. KCTC 42545]|nr:hypothetical protein [Paucibacter sp. KCTC 42545]
MLAQLNQQGHGQWPGRSVGRAALLLPARARPAPMAPAAIWVVPA